MAATIAIQTLGLRKRYDAAVAPRVTERRHHPDPGPDGKVDDLEVELSKTSEVWNDLGGYQDCPTIWRTSCRSGLIPNTGG
jgi:hypothetical protein